MGTMADQLAIYTTQAEMSSFFIDKMGVISIKSYDAVGGGVTDDTVKIQDAIDAANDLGYVAVFWPEGSYNVGTLTDYSGLTFYSFGDVSFTNVSYTVFNLTHFAPMITDVRAYGAACDGVTDDTDAVKYAYSKTRHLSFPDDCVLKETLELEDDTELVFYGKIILDLLDSELTPSATGYDFLSAYRCAFSAVEKDNITFKNLHFIGAFDPDYGYQGTPIFDTELSQCILFMLDCTNVKIDGLAIENYSGWASSTAIQGDQTYPFDINNPVNPIKISRCANVEINNLRWEGCSSEELMLFDCPNSRITGVYSDSEMISCLGVWYSDGTTVEDIKILEYTYGNAINVYSNNCVVKNGLFKGGLSTKFGKYCMTSIDFSNEANILGITGYTTNADNNTLSDCVFENAGIYLTWPTDVAYVGDVNNGLIIDSCNFVYDPENIYEYASGTAVKNCVLLLTENTYKNIKMCNCNVIGVELQLLYAATSTIENLEFDNVKTVSTNATLRLMTSAGASGSIKLKNCEIETGILGLLDSASKIDISFDNCNVKASSGITYSGTDMDTFTFENSYFECIGDYSPGSNSLACVLYPGNSALTVDEIYIANNRIKAPSVFKLDFAASRTGTITKLTIKDNVFQLFGSASRAFNSPFNYKFTEIFYEGNVFETSDTCKTLYIDNYGSLHLANNVGEGLIISAALNTLGTEAMQSYGTNNNVATIAATNMEGKANRNTGYENDAAIALLADAAAVFTAYAKQEIVFCSSVPSFMYPSGKTSSTGKLIMFPKQGTILYLPITNDVGNVITNGFLGGSTITWLAI